MSIFYCCCNLLPLIKFFFQLEWVGDVSYQQEHKVQQVKLVIQRRVAKNSIARSSLVALLISKSIPF